MSSIILGVDQLPFHDRLRDNCALILERFDGDVDERLLVEDPDAVWKQPSVRVGNLNVGYSSVDGNLHPGISVLIKGYGLCRGISAFHDLYGDDLTCRRIQRHPEVRQIEYAAAVIFPRGIGVSPDHGRQFLRPAVHDNGRTVGQTVRIESICPFNLVLPAGDNDGIHNIHEPSVIGQIVLCSNPVCILQTDLPEGQRAFRIRQRHKLHLSPRKRDAVLFRLGRLARIP